LIETARTRIDEMMRKAAVQNITSGAMKESSPV
jgi:hypothetical protein